MKSLSVFVVLIFSLGMIVGCGSDNNQNPLPSGGQQPGSPPNIGMPQPPQGSQPPPMVPVGNPPPMPIDPNIGFLPPMGHPIGLPQCERYFQGLQCPHTHQPIFQPHMVPPWARRCRDHRYDLRRYNEVFYFFASLQGYQHTSYLPLFHGHSVVRMTTAVFEQYGHFDLNVYRRHYHSCLHRGLVGIHAVQEAFYSMNINISIQSYM